MNIEPYITHTVPHDPAARRGLTVKQRRALMQLHACMDGQCTQAAKYGGGLYLCVETGDVFASSGDVKRLAGISQFSNRHRVRGGAPERVGGLTWKFLDSPSDEATLPSPCTLAAEYVDAEHVDDYVVYECVDADGRVVYVGHTDQPLAERLRQHLRSGGALHGLQSDDVSIRAAVRLSGVTRRRAFAAETEHVHRCIAAGEPLLNSLNNRNQRTPGDLFPLAALTEAEQRFVLTECTRIRATRARYTALKPRHVNPRITCAPGLDVDGPGVFVYTVSAVVDGAVLYVGTSAKVHRAWDPRLTRPGGPFTRAEGGDVEIHLLSVHTDPREARLAAAKLVVGLVNAGTPPARLTPIMVKRLCTLLHRG